MAANRKHSLLSKLKKAVEKVKFLLTSFKASQWIRIASALGHHRRSGSLVGRKYTRHLSISAGQDDDVGLYGGGCMEDASSCGGGGLTSSKVFHRMRSYDHSFHHKYDDHDHEGGYSLDDREAEVEAEAEEEEDYNVDRRADLFIANFHRQLRMERQISLELRYCRLGTEEST
ncbi:hypothetical protein Ancab_023125 [Ancistrocladus abbreviatus]